MNRPREGGGGYVATVHIRKYFAVFNDYQINGMYMMGKLVRNALSLVGYGVLLLSAPMVIPLGVDGHIVGIIGLWSLVVLFLVSSFLGIE